MHPSRLAVVCDACVRACVCAFLCNGNLNNPIWASDTDQSSSFLCENSSTIFPASRRAENPCPQGRASLGKLIHTKCKFLARLFGRAPVAINHLTSPHPVHNHPPRLTTASPQFPWRIYKTILSIPHLNSSIFQSKHPIAPFFLRRQFPNLFTLVRSKRLTDNSTQINRGVKSRSQTPIEEEERPWLAV